MVNKLGNTASFGSDPRRVETAGNQQFGTQQEALTATIQARYDSLKMSYQNPKSGGDVAKDSTVDSQEKESLIFFFHPDHLGSTSYVTGADGNVAQHVEYIPYGEVFVEERNSSFSTSYLFNAKELDEETGMYYYGARYLDPTAAMWISVDPMWEKFAGMSAYNYCVGNPVKMVDPDGREISGATEEDAKSFHYDLSLVFKDKRFDDFRSLLKLNKNVFEKIDDGDLQSLLKSENLNDDDKALINIVASTINSKTKHTVEYFNDKATSFRTKQILSPELSKIGIDVEKTIEFYGGIPEFVISNRGGDGVTGKIGKGSHSVVSNMSKEREVVASHEVFGHGRAIGVGRNSTASQHQDAVQFSNLVYRVMGNPTVLDGSTHGPRTILPNATSIPNQLIGK